MMRTSVVTHALFAVALLCSAACREIHGQCSTRADTLCLQIDVVDRRVIPDDLQLNLSAAGMSKLADFPNVTSILSQRPYLVEIELPSPLPTELSIDASGYLSPTKQKIAAAQLMLSPATAARPTVLTLASLGGGGGQDMSPAGPDLQPTDWKMVYFSRERPLTSISGTTSGGLAILAGGSSNVVVHGNGTTFTAEEFDNDGAAISGIWLASATAAWICDRGGRIWATQSGGKTWNLVDDINYPLNGIYGRSNTDIVAVGDSPLYVAHWDGTSWNNVSHTAGVPFYGVWASSTAYYIAGGSGQGARSSTPKAAGPWTLIANLNSMTLRGMSGYKTANDMDTYPLAVGDGGTVEYYNMVTTKWVDLRFPKPTVKLAAAWVSGVAKGYVVGAAGTVYSFNNGAWVPLGSSNLNGYDLTGIWGDGAGGLWVSASNGTDGAIFKH